MEVVRKIIEVEDLKSSNRKREYNYKRCYLYAYLKYTYRLSLQAIGREFNRDHATVINGLKNYEIFKDDKLFNELTKDIQMELEMGIIPRNTMASCLMYQILAEQDKRFYK